MLNPRLDQLGDYPFEKLRALLARHDPPDGVRPLVLSVGEPRHPPPALVAEVLAEHAGDWGRYPPIEGTAELRAAACGWLERRFHLQDAGLDPDRHVLPVAGTREALYLAAAVCAPERRGGGRSAVLMPNPFYHVYFGAAVMHGGDAVFMPATRDTGWQPDIDAVDPGVLARTALAYLCSPANPQGAVLSMEALQAWIRLARLHDFVLIVDECYTEIYGSRAPPGVLEACRALGGGFENVLSFHSLSKRSNVPGLRSGFVAGDPSLVAAFRRLRAYSAATLPLPVMAVSAALWLDDSHVAANRALYDRKFDMAKAVLAGRFGFFRPDGGFFLWLDVGDDEAAASALWAKSALRSLPGRYMGRPDASGDHPGAGFLRVALIDDLDATEDALRRIDNVLQK